MKLQKLKIKIEGIVVSEGKSELIKKVGQEEVGCCSEQQNFEYGRYPNDKSPVKWGE